MKRLLTGQILMVLSSQADRAQVDIHCHMIPDSYLEAITAHGKEMDEGFPIPAWSAEEHLEFMDEAGIQTSVLTMPAPQPYFGDGAESAATCRKFNEEAAALKALHPGRFLFCASLPLPDVDKAIEEAEYALEVLGADGVKLASNSYGQYPGDPELESLLTITEPSHILYGSDYPYVAAPALIGAKKSLVARLAAHGLFPEDILTNNAARLFGADIPFREYGERVVRLAQIEIHPECLEEYLTFAKEVGTVSMATEPGVIGLFSMQDKSDPCKVYILEVYADRDAYQAHLQTVHFKKYKEGTAEMVKSLELMDTNPMITAPLKKSAIR